VGIVEGQWLHGLPLSSATTAGKGGSTLGVGVPITYVLPLLEQKHIPWQPVSGPAR
jgi:hypothetical protein